MSVLTILNHGTGSRRDKPNEIVADFAANMDGLEIRQENPDSNGQLEGDYLITDGPGSGKGTTENPLPGSYNVYTGQKKVGNTFGSRSFKQDFYGQTRNMGGNLPGVGKVLDKAS